MSIFTKVVAGKPRRGSFNLSSEHFTTCKMGQLIPVVFYDVVPTDRFRKGTAARVQFAPLFSPVMQKMDLFVYDFFVPYRLLWDGWEDFITRGVDGASTIVHPYFKISVSEDLSEKSLSFRLGYPKHINKDEMLNPFPAAAYNLIWNEYFRDQNLQDELRYKLDDGQNAWSGFYSDLQNVCWSKDLFTSALPWTQRGNPVRLRSNVIFNDVGETIFRGSNQQQSESPVLSRKLARPGESVLVNDEGFVLDVDNSEQLSVDSVDILSLRRANWLQRFQERSALGGSRYIEQIFAFFGAKSSDARLQRPQYLGGTRIPVGVVDVPNTAGVSGANVQGYLSGEASLMGSGRRWKHYFEEYGIVMSLAVVRPKPLYMSAVDKYFMKRNYEDYFNPFFQFIGEQPINGVEVNGASTVSTRMTDVFGYAPRYYEYKQKLSQVSGDMYSDSDTNLSTFHMARRFPNDAKVNLNDSFVKCVPTKRIFNVTDANEDDLWMHFSFDTKANRPIVKHVVSKL